MPRFSICFVMQKVPSFRTAIPLKICLLNRLPKLKCLGNILIQSKCDKPLLYFKTKWLKTILFGRHRALDFVLSLVATLVPSYWVVVYLSITLYVQKPFVPKRYFSIDRVFRNEAVDRTHLAEFHQIEGIYPPFIYRNFHK